MSSVGGRVCVVTGAARGLGQAIAAALGAAGGRLALCDVLDAELQQTADELREQGVEVFAAHCDVSDSASVDAFFAAVEQQLGPVEALINNAALVPGGPEDEVRRSTHYAYITTPQPRTSLGFTSAMSDEEWLKYWGVNVHGTFYCTRAALRQMEPRGYGRIVNIASIAGLSNYSAHSPHYSATKGAVIAYEGFPPFDNRDDFVAIYRQMGCTPDIFDIHHAANGIITFENATRARGQWSLYFHNINLAGRTLTQMGVEYDDVYVKEDGRWWIAETRSRRTSCLIHSVDADGAAKVSVMGEAPATFG